MTTPYPISHVEAVRRAEACATGAHRMLGDADLVGTERAFHRLVALGTLWTALAGQLPIVEDVSATETVVMPAVGPTNVRSARELGVAYPSRLDGPGAGICAHCGPEARRILAVGGRWVHENGEAACEPR